MDELSERERIIRVGMRRTKREQWAHVRELILSHGEQHWLDFWREHWPPNKWDMGYAIGRDTPHLRRHVRIQLHYLRMPVERQERLEPVLWG